MITKRDLQQPLHKLIPAGMKPRELYVANTSGSSGHPFYFAKDKLCHALSWALHSDRWAQYSLTTRSKQARFYGIPFDAVYGPGLPKGEALPELLTTNAVLGALERAAGAVRQSERTVTERF